MKVPRRARPQATSAVTRRIAYSLAAGAASMATDAEALIIYSGIEDISIAQGNKLNLLFDADSFLDIELKNYSYQSTPGGGGPVNYQGAFMPYAVSAFVGKRVNNFNYVRALTTGFEVNASAVDGQCGGNNCFVGSLASGAVNPNAEFNNVQDVFIGLRFMTNIQPDWNQRVPHFGWVRVSIDNEAGTFVVHEWAWESEPGVPIITGDRGPAGDYNGDGVVDAADYTVWRNNLGTDFDLAGHGDETGSSLGVVDGDDYTLWKANYGWPGTLYGSGSTANFVPEPGALGFLAAGSLGVMALRRRRGG